MFKRVLIILTIISIVLAIGLLGVSINIKLGQISTRIISRHIVHGKRYGQSAELRSFVKPGPAVEEFVIKNNLNKGTQLERIANVYNIIEKNYTYTPDDNAKYENDGVIVKGGPDIWLFPHETIAMLEQTGGVNLDCEDGAFAIEAIGLQAGIKNIWTCIGTVTLYDPETGKILATGGHGWDIVKYQGNWCLLESTMGKPLKSLVPINSLKYVKYNAQFTFNNKVVNSTIGANLNEVIDQPPLPPSGREKLVELLKLSGL